MGSREGFTTRNLITCSTHLIQPSRLRYTRHVTSMERGRDAFKMLTVKPKGKRTLGRRKRRWEDNIRMDVKEIVDVRKILFPYSK